MIKLLQLRCYRNYSPLNVFNITKRGQQSNMYKIVLGRKRKIGSFKLSKNGFISSLVIKRKFRKKKTCIDALLTLYEFVIKKAKEKGIDCLYFTGHSKNPNNVVRLYSKVASAFADGETNTFLLPVNNKGQEILDSFKNPIGLPDPKIDEEVMSLITKMKTKLNR